MKQFRTLTFTSVVSLLWVISAQACTDTFAQCLLGLHVPAFNEVLLKADSKKNLPTLPEQKFTLLTWNIYKGSGATWEQDLARLAGQSDMALIQEAIWSPQVKGKLTGPAFEQFSWNFATSFLQKKEHRATGVMTGAVSASLRTTFVRSPDLEPVTETPKMALFTRYPLADGRELLVVNVHGINFSPDIFAALRRQMDLIELVISKHGGPAILAGDFNTWIVERSNIVTEMAQRNGFFEVKVPQDPRSLVLDHVFVRDLMPMQVRLHSEVQSSDHYPISVELRY